MKDNYDFSKGKKNPFASKEMNFTTQKEQIKKDTISIRLNHIVIPYFKKLSEEVGMPYQTLIDSYLIDCVKKHKKPKTSWE